MSDRLAVSASFSILMMSIYVLFGSDSVRAPIGAQDLNVPASIAGPSTLLDPWRQIKLP